MTWWRQEQSKGSKGLKHKQRFNSNLDVERALSKTGGQQWMQVALDRDRRRGLTAEFVAQHDTSWATERQTQLDNLTPTQTHMPARRGRGMLRE